MGGGVTHVDSDETVTIEMGSSSSQITIAPPKKKRATLQEEIMDLRSVEGFRLHSVKYVVFWALVACTCGIMYLLYFWFKKQGIRIVYKRSTLTDAQYVLVTGYDNHYEFCEVEPFHRLPHSKNPQRKFDIDAVPLEERMFVYKHLRYYYSQDKRTWMPVENSKVLVERYVDSTFRPLTAEEHARIQTRVGENLIDIPVAPIPVLLFREVLHPFFHFPGV